MNVNCNKEKVDGEIRDPRSTPLPEKFKDAFNITVEVPEK